jgi:hypothetical protein
MRINVVIFLIVVLSCIKTCAQVDSLAAKRFTYFNNVLAGSLLGKRELGSSLTLSTIHGVRFKNLSVGIGAGYDTYQYWRTMPVFATVIFDVARFKNDNALFFQMAGGHAWAWRAKIENDPYKYREDGGITIQPGIGYRIKTNQWSLYVSAAYKMQRINYERISRWWDWEVAGNRTTVEQEINRVSIQIGFGLH